jgi:YgiT-type zinc finger domain-containing protein
MKSTKNSLKGEACEYCDGTLTDVVLTETFRVRGRLIVVEDVPVGMCTTCGEKYFPAVVLKRVEAMASRTCSGSRIPRAPVFPYRRRRTAT